MSKREPNEAAPVVNESGTWGTIPNTFDEFGPGAGFRELVSTVTGILLIIVLISWLTVLSLYQSTSQEVALPSIERAVVVLTEVDALLELHIEESKNQATTGPSITIPGFPLQVSVPSAAVITNNSELDHSLLRQELVRRSALLLQAKGFEAFRDPNGKLIPPSHFSSTGLMSQIIDNLTTDDHNRWGSLTPPLGYISLSLATILLLLGIGFGRLIRLGVAVAIAGALVLIPALLIRISIGFLGDDNVIGEEVRTIMRTLASTPIRNGLLMTIGGVAIALPAIVLDRLFENSERRAL